MTHCRLCFLLALFFITSQCFAQQIVITAMWYPPTGVGAGESGRLSYTLPPDIDTCIKVIPVIFEGNDYVDSVVFTGPNVKYTDDKLHILSRGTFLMEIYWHGRRDLHQLIDVGPKPAPEILYITSVPANNCENETVTYTAYVYAAHDKALYQWQLNGVDTGSNSPAFTGILKSNDKLKLTVTNFDICSTSADSRTISIPVLKPSTSHIVTVTASENPLCSVHPVTYTASTNSPAPGMSYQWQLNGVNVGDNKATYTNANPLDGDKVRCTVGNPGSCVLPVTSPVFVVKIGEVPTVKFDGNVTIAYGGSIQLNPITNDHVSRYLWTPADGLSDRTIANPVANPARSTKYRLTVYSIDGCMADASLTVKVAIMIPNTFTPNGDGINDTWNIPQLIYYPDCKLKVYNRLGSLVYQSVGYTKAWDGTHNGRPLSTGVYYYIIEADHTTLTGNITIVR